MAQLRMAWSRGLPAGVQESTPIVYRGVMYVMAPGASVQALDATNGDLIWEYRRNYAPGVPATAARSKSLGIYEDMIYFGAPDGFLLALDAHTGKLRWETKVDNGQITAGGLLVADGKVISNRTCEQGKREFCFIAAHDAEPARKCGSSTSPLRLANRAATRGATCQSRSAPRPMGPAWFVRSRAPGRLLGRGQSRIRIPASSDTAGTTRPHRPRPRSCTAIRPWRSTSRPASWSGISRSSLATTGTRITTRNAFWFARV